MTWWTAFLLTQAIEMPVYALAMRGTPLSWAWRASVAFGASALTHPVVWFVLPGLFEPSLGWWGYVLVAETFAVVAEALYLRAFAIPRPWAWALAANGLSATIGLWINLR